MRPIKVGLFSDLHCGHDVGLCPPERSPTPAEAAPRRERKQWEVRKRIWGWFDENVTMLGPFDVAVWCGDMIDGTGEKTGGAEDSEIPEQVETAVDIVRRVDAPVNWFARGTPYHVGAGKQTWEDLVYSALANPKDEIGDEIHAAIRGLSVDVKHKIGNASSPVSQFTALSSERIRQLLWAEMGQQPRANLLLRGHIHRCQSISEPMRNFAAWSLPALQGLGSVFGARSVNGLPVHVGFCVLTVQSKNDWGVDAYGAPMEMQKAHVVEYDVVEDGCTEKATT